jgi:hypothetical protein
VASKPAGETTQHLTATGRVQHESVKKADGTQQTTHYAANGNVQKTVTLKNDGTKVTTHVQYGRNGKERATETVKVDVRGREIGKTVVVKQTTIIARKTILRDVTVVKNYDRSPFGFAYHPVYGASLPVLASWYDPYWYSSSGVYVSHPFHYSWGWQASDWYQYQPHYFAAYDVYPTPSYWLTDWMIAGYVADRFAASASAAHSREEARLAREDAARAGALAAQATEQAEIAEARGAQREAEARAALAEARAAKAESQELAGGSLSANSNATPIDNDTKEALRAQIEQTVADNKRIAEETAKGQTPVVPDLSEALADPKHIYPVSQSINVIAAADQNAAGTLTEGDLLKLEPGQASLLNHAGENTFVTMRVMTSNGEDGEVKAGTLISISLKALQDFDSEFRAKLDVGLAEADKNQDQFRSAAL